MPEARYAVLIGNCEFPDEPHLSRLRCPENDVTGMREWLSSTKNGLFDAANIATLIKESVRRSGVTPSCVLAPAFVVSA